MTTKTANRNSLVPVWAGLMVLTALSILLGEHHGHASWMPLLVAVIIWIKGTMVARYFLESDRSHPFITWLLRAFIAFVPIALLFTDNLSR